MVEFRIDISGFTEREAEFFTRTPAKSIGGIVVRPPIQIGESFNKAVLGREAFEVSVSHISSTSEATVLLAESGRGDKEDRKADIRLIAERIVQLANRPETVVDLIESNPFSAPNEF